MDSPRCSGDAAIAAAARHGLIVRGGFVVAAEDEVPEISAGIAAQSLLLFGNAGSSMWDVFKRSAEYHDRRPNPLNRWSERIGRKLAGEFSARALFPFGGPHRPFLRWGKKAETLQNSHLGMLIHPQFGLWHAYRFALAFAQPMATVLPESAKSAAHSMKNICRQCVPKPCRGACPVNAFSDAGYDVQACFRYLESHPDSACMSEGCQARVACPQGTGYRYRASHAAFHMRAFVVAMATSEFSEATRNR